MAKVGVMLEVAAAPAELDPDKFGSFMGDVMKLMVGLEGRANGEEIAAMVGYLAGCAWLCTRDGLELSDERVMATIMLNAKDGMAGRPGARRR